MERAGEPLYFSLSPEIRRMVSALAKLRTSPRVEDFLASMDYVPGEMTAINGVEDVVERNQAARYLGWLDLSLRFGISVSEVLGSGRGAVISISEEDGSIKNLPIEKFVEGELGELFEVPFTPDVSARVYELQQFWLEQTGGSEQAFLEMMLSHLLWCLEEVESGAEVSFVDVVSIQIGE